MTYQLLALDLDGTVVESDLVISPRVPQAIAAAQARGVRVTIATGRMFGATMPFVRALGVRDPVICYQGGMVRHPHTGEIYQHALMPAAPAAESVALLLAAGLFVVAYIDERLCVAERRAELDMYLSYHPEGAEVVVAPDLPALVRETPPTKILFVAQPEQVGAQLERLGAHFAGTLSTVRSHQLFGELTPLGISKGAALATLAGQLGIPQARVMAIGDHENDLEMIRWAGLGLAMGNAIPAAKQAAKAVLPTVREDGVAVAIERYILNAEPSE